MGIKRLLGSTLAKETGISLFLKIFQAFFSFMTTVLLARILGAEGYGIYAYAFAFVMLLSMLAQAGLPTLVAGEITQGMALARGINIVLNFILIPSLDKG